MHRVYSSWLGPNFGVQPAAKNDFYLRLSIEKMRVFSVFTDKYLRPCGCSSPNFTAMVYYKNPKIEIKSETFKIQITEIQI